MSTAFKKAKIDYASICKNGESQLNYEDGNPGLGVHLFNFAGDGFYDVEARYDDRGDISEIAIIFDNDRLKKNSIHVKYLGKVGVDSGQLLITDPCYIL